MIAWLERNFGANWRTSLSGLLTTLCVIILAIVALPAETWDDRRVAVFAILGVIAKTVKDFTTKDAQVTGGNVAQGPGYPARHAGQVEDTLP